MHRTFSTSHPVSLYVELRSGGVVVQAGDTDEPRVDVSGEGADDVVVDQRGDEIVVVARQGRQGLFGTSHEDLSITVSVPSDSTLVTKLGSADLRTQGRLAEATLSSGSGDVRAEELGGACVVTTGNGDVAIGRAGAALQVKSGSGDVALGAVAGPLQVSTGSGDVRVHSAADTVRVKSGSGGLHVREALADVALSSASGELVVDVLHRGQLTARTASGDVTVGVRAGVPVWTDISTSSGTVRSTLQGAGEPADGQEYVELRAKTASGDVSLHQV
jgi:hypothetical protein